MIHWLRTIDYCFRLSVLSTYLCKFFHFLDNDDRMSSKRRNLSALVFLINLITKVNLIRLCMGNKIPSIMKPKKRSI